MILENRCYNCLRRLTCPDSDRMTSNDSPAPACFVGEVVFSDDIILAINTGKGTCTTIILTPPYDERQFTLEDLRKQFGATLVLHETPLHGNLYRYGNHEECWEQIGTTQGYA